MAIASVHNKAPTVVMSTRRSKKEVKALNNNTSHADARQKQAVQEDLPPLGLIFTVMICSGILLILAMRDFCATGKVIGGSWDEAMLVFTKSTQWFDDSNSWKSTQGGFSAIQKVTTDDNNMGGFFVRKLAGAAALTVHLQKMLPLLFHASGAKWIHGHFQAVLWCGLLANCAILAFYASYMEDLMNFEAAELPKLLMGLLTTESLVFVYYLFTTRTAKRGPAIAMTNGKTETSVASKIVARTIAIVSGVTCVIALRDLLLPGYIFDFIPRDDIYLEWTNVFLHSPPDGTPESNDQGLEAPLFVGDKFIAQFAALHILLCCMYKFVSCFWIRYGSDGSGAITSGMFWKTQTIGDALLLFNFRLFSSSANSASLDLRWHLMALAYETFILGLYAFF